MSLTLPLLAVPDPADGGFNFTQAVAGNPTIYARLAVKGSEVVAWLGALKPAERRGDELLIVLADAFTLDCENFGAARAIKIVARVFTAPLTPLTLSIPAMEPKKPFAFEVVAGQARGSVFSIVFTMGNTWEGHVSFYRDQADVEANGAATYLRCVYGNFPDADGKKAYRSKRICEPLKERAGEGARAPGCWNRLRALFPLACDQVGVAAERAVGLSRLAWIARLTASLAGDEGPYQIEASHLMVLAGAMIQLTPEEGRPRPVPSLSEETLTGRIQSHLRILGHYEDEIRTLDTRGDIQITAESLAGAWRQSIDDDEAVLGKSAQRLEGELEAQLTEYNSLCWAYQVQEESLKTTWILFKGGLERSAILKTTAAVLELIGSMVQLYMVYYGAANPNAVAGQAAVVSQAAESARAASAAAGGNEVAQAAAAAKAAAEAQAAVEKQAKQVTKAAVDAEKKIADQAAALDRGVMDTIKRNAVKAAGHLKNVLEKSAKAGQSIAKAAAKIQELQYVSSIKDRGAVELPDLADLTTSDAQHEWHIFMTEVEVMLREFINDKDERVEGAKEYYIALVALAEYGKAIGIKIAALARLQSQRLQIAEQRAALRLAVERWALLETEARTKAEKLALARSILDDAALNAKHSLLVLAEGYRAAYAYANLKETSLRFRLSMSRTQLEQEFDRLSKDADAFFAIPKVAQKMSTDFFELPVVTEATKVFPTVPHAVLHVPAAGKPWLAWSLPIDDPPFKEWLSDARRSGYFIQEARFFLDGVTAGPSVTPGVPGTVKLRVSTMGNYDNGYGGEPKNIKRFSAVGYALDYIYAPSKGENEAPSTSWLPDKRSKKTYMSPTPFTSWTAVIEHYGSVAHVRALRIKLTLLRQDTQL